MSTTAAGILIPVGQGYAAAANAAKSAGQVVTRQAIAQSIAYEVGKDTIAGMAGYGAAQAGAWGGTALFGEDAGRWIGLGSGFLAGLLTAKGIDGLNAKYNLNGLAPMGVPNAVRAQGPMNGLEEVEIGQFDSVAEQYRHNHVITVESAEDVNAAFIHDGDLPPYKPGTVTAIVEVEPDQQYVRVFTDGKTNPAGGWIMRASDIENLTPSQIQDPFALPNLPTHVTDVVVAPGVQMRTGIANGLFGNGGGGQQFQLLEYLPNSAWQNLRPLPIIE